MATQNRSLSKPLPQDIEAEQAVLGSMMLTRDIVPDVLRIIPPTDVDAFFVPQHRTIFAALCDLYESGRPIDMLSLRDELQKREQLKDVGELEYICELAESVPSSWSAPYYAEMIRNKYALRELIAVSGELRRSAEEPDADPKSLLDQYEGFLLQIASKRIKDDYVHVADAIKEAFDEIERRQSNVISGEVKTHWSKIDECLGGLHNGEMIVVAARPSMGKTSFGLQIAEAAASFEPYVPTLFFSLEMGRRQIVERLLCMRCEIDSQKVRKGLLNEQEYQKLQAEAERLENTKIFIDDNNPITLFELKAKVRAAKRMDKVGLVVIDYLQLLRAGFKTQGRQEEVSEISKGIKSLARQMDIPIVVMAQLNRNPEGRTENRPRMSDLRECVDSDTQLILADTGQPIAVRDLSAGQRIMAMSSDQKIVPASVDRVWSTGRKQAFDVRTASGHVVTATANHPFLTEHGWRRVDRLEPGMRVAVAFNIQTGSTRGLDLAEARLLGYLVGNGSYMENSTIGLIIPDEEAFSDACAIISARWPSVAIKKRCNEYNDAWISCVYANGHGKPHGNPMREWLRSLGMIGQRDKTKRAPAKLFVSGKDCICEFLGAYLAADGCVASVGDRWSVRFDTTSLGLAHDIQHLLARIGVFATISGGYVSSKATTPIYRVSLSGDARNIISFWKQVEPRGYRGRLLNEAAQDSDRRQTRHSALSLPRCVSEYAATVEPGWRHQGKTISRKRCGEIAISSDDYLLNVWAKSDIAWSEVVSVLPGGERDTFDLRVPMCGCFVANGMIVHNSGSIEQDADVVILLHRPEYYQKDVIKRGLAKEVAMRSKAENDAIASIGVAEIIIDKQRNGPTGIETLYWRSDYTRFDAMSTVQAEEAKQSLDAWNSLPDPAEDLPTLYDQNGSDIPEQGAGSTLPF